MTSARIPAGEAAGPLVVGNVEVHEAARWFSVAGRQTTITTKERALLELLIRRADKVLDRSDIIKLVYPPDTETEQKNIDALVLKLCKKLSFAGAEIEISAVSDRGYTLKILPHQGVANGLAPIGSAAFTQGLTTAFNDAARHAVSTAVARDVPVAGRPARSRQSRSARSPRTSVSR